MSERSISLCMIVKDEEEHLADCLASVDGLMKEMIIVDTGSTDRTRDIAREFGATVIETTWNDDFAQARNVGLERARGEWILFLDADERLETKDRQKLLQLASLKQFEGFFLNVYNYGGNGRQGASVNPVLRMFRNRARYRFQGRIHEQIAGPILTENPNARFRATDIRVHHLGYLDRTVMKKNKIARNVQLLRQTLRETPDDPFHWHNLGVEWLRMNEPAKALRAFRKALTLITDPVRLSYAHLVCKYEIRCLHQLRRLEEAAETIEKAIALFPAYTDLRHLKGVNLWARGKTEEAKNALLEAIKLGPAPPPFHTEEGIGDYQTYFLLGQIEEENGDFSAAIDCYVAALRAKPSLNPPLYRIFRVFKCVSDERRIVDWIQQRLRLSSSEAVQKVIQILLDVHCFEAAWTLLDENAARDDIDALHQKCYCLFMLRRVDEARALLRQILLRVPPENRARALPAWLRIFNEKQHPASVAPSDADQKRSVELSYRLGNRPAAMTRLDDWLENLRDSSNPNRWRTLSRCLVSLAENRLSETSFSTSYRQAVQKARLQAPRDDGF